MDGIIWIVVILVAIVQIMMVVRFFDIAADIKDIRDMLCHAIMENKPSQNNIKEIEVLVEEKEKSKDDPKKFTWQSWVALAVIIIGILLYLLSR